MLAMDVEWGVPIVALVLLVLFGGAKIPELARSLGRAKSEFEKGSADSDPTKSDTTNDASKPDGR